MEVWIPFVIIGVVVSGAAWMWGRARERAAASGQRDVLHRGSTATKEQFVDFDSISGLPAPVQRYFRLALHDGQPMIKAARLQQTGTLRTAPDSRRWLDFTAEELVVPPAKGFLWDARVQLPVAGHIRVLDGYAEGAGRGRVSLLSATRLASEENIPELNSGALHRYLAEAVWFPTALLPQAGVKWQPIDSHRARATLSNAGATVSLEFRFNDEGEVTSVFSPGRFARFGREYRQTPWEGHFGLYENRQAMRVPRYGEVGWYVNGALELVWKGNVTDTVYEFDTEVP